MSFNKNIPESMRAEFEKWVQKHPKSFEAMTRKYGRPIGPLSNRGPQLD